MQTVTEMSYEDFVAIDPAARLKLSESLGDVGAEGLISRTLEDVANRLTLLERCHYQKDYSAMAKAASGIEGLAQKVGLTALAVAAHNVADCCELEDPVATVATTARLVRLGDRALTAVWDTRGVSI